MYHNVLIYVFFGILPSLVWLAYYLTKDLHPEPKRMIIKIFLWGALITVPVYFVEKGIESLLYMANLSPASFNILYWFVAIGFTEEFFKYLVVRAKVVNSPHLDEPLDIMLYMVVAALGFAAVENVLYLFLSVGQISLDSTLTLDVIRFIGAVFLHTLCSAVIGYSMAISFCQAKRKFIPLIIGMVIAIFMHGFFDLSMVILPDNLKIVGPIAVILILAILVFSGFEKLKKMKGICKIA